MATLTELDASGAIFKIDPELPFGTQPERLIYASTRMVRWLDQVLPALPSDLGVEISPLEQVGNLFEDFCGGKELAVGPRFHALHPGDAAVWELKTPDIRLFGWFVVRDCFFAYAGDTANRIKTHGLYAGYRNSTVQFRNRLDLDPPTFVPGEDPNAVVSNYHYP
jgi:hypothetical protein